MKNNKKYILIVILIIVLITIDQLCKWYVIQNNEKNKIFISSESKENPFEMENNITFTDIITNIIIICIIIKFMNSQKEQLNKGQFILLSFVLAGGFSNLFDMIFRGNVVDFIKIGKKLPSTNLAEIYIFVGWVLLAYIFAYHTYREIHKNKRNKGDCNEH